VGELIVKLGTGVVPVPFKDTVCGEPLALSVTLSVAESVIADAGVNVTEMVQDPAGASVVPQVVVSANDVGLLPASETAMPVRVAVPGFESVKTCAADVVATLVEAKVKVVGDRTA
jgi:hypothetical protein